jgi:hypothetical protein
MLPKHLIIVKKSHHTNRKRPRGAPERKPVPEHTNATLFDTSNCHLGIPPVPGMNRSPKEKSDPGKVAPCKYWSG